MLLTVLGSGTSTGVPIIGCDCKVCKSKNPKNQRLRSSVWIQTRNKSLIIDTTTDFRMQALRAKIRKIDLVLYTHPHADHIHGIDELRAYNFAQKTPIPIYGNDWTIKELKVKFPYIFTPGPVEGGGIPQLLPEVIPDEAKLVNLQGIPVQLLPFMHGSKPNLGFRIESVAYLTDCSYIPETTLEKLKGLDALLLDCVRLKPHRTHYNLDQALETAARLKPKKTYLTHLGHDFDHSKFPKKLPKGVYLAFDGLKIRTGSSP